MVPVQVQREGRAYPVSAVTGRRRFRARPITAVALGGRRNLRKPAGESLLKTLFAAVCLPAIDDKDVQGEAVASVERMRFTDVQSQVTLHTGPSQRCQQL